VLYTLLAKLSVDWWGPSEWAIRIPSLAGGAFYMLACMGLVTLIFESTWSSVVVYCALILNPMVLDYMSAARGYSLALGFLFCALLVILRTFLKPAGRVVDAGLHLAIGVALGLSAAANLAFLIPNGILVAVFLLVPFLLRQKVDSEKVGIQAAVLLAGAGITFSELMFGTFEGANVSTFALGEASVVRSIYILFLRSLHVPTVPGGGLLPPLLAVVTTPLLVACLAGVIYYCLRKTAMPGKAEALLLFPLTLIGSAAALVVLHVAIGLPYPYERTGIYFLPLMTFTVAAGIEVEWKILSRAAVFFLCAITLQYALEVKTGWYEEWRFDAGTKRAMLAFREEHEGQSGTSRMGISWEYEAGVTYYARVLHLDWLAQVTREDPRSGDFEYYYLKEEDQGLVAQKGLVVLYRDPVSHAVLARRK
jgi:hypothetical protein